MATLKYKSGNEWVPINLISTVDDITTMRTNISSLTERVETLEAGAIEIRTYTTADTSPSSSTNTRVTITHDLTGYTLIGKVAGLVRGNISSEAKEAISVAISSATINDTAQTELGFTSSGSTGRTVKGILALFLLKNQTQGTNTSSSTGGGETTTGVDNGYFQVGETFTIGNPSFLSGRTNSTGANATGTVFLPKKIPSGMTVTANGVSNGIFIGSASYTPTTISISAIAESNSINITAYASSLPASTVCVIATGAITLTFG